MNIGIIGLGFLGGSMERYFCGEGKPLFLYDKKGIGSPEEVNKADMVFICVNTPYDQHKKDINLSYVESAVEALTGEKIVVLRSTIPPGTTDRLQARHPQHTFLFNPEFLRAKFAFEDFTAPPRQVVGYTLKSKDAARTLIGLLPKAPQEFTTVVPAKSAELLKYASNTALAARVALANKLFEFSEALGINYDEIKGLLAADSRIGGWGFDILYEGFRGYSGTCFPKDVRTLIALGKKVNVNMNWLEALDDENLALIRTQGLEPDYGHPKV